MFRGIKTLSVGTKVALGFTLVTLILIVAVASTIQQVLNMEAISNRVINQRVPTAQTSLMLLNGVNHSLASLRGWISGQGSFQGRTPKCLG